MVKSTSLSGHKRLVTTTHSTQLFPEPRIEATTEVSEDGDGHVRVYAPAVQIEEELADLEVKFADRSGNILVERGVFICSAVS